MDPGEGDRDVMLVDCRPTGGPPPGSTYIGRAMPETRRRRRLEASPLRNPFKPKGGKGDGIEVRDVIERYRRHLTWRLAQGEAAPAEALRALTMTSRLACWCASRHAAELVGEIEYSEGMCHGDVVYTAWVGLKRIGWSWETVDPCLDLPGFGRAHAGLYEACFQQPLVWRQNR